jgi:2-methylisocitrate lyase-like PEP mutase family enzyme
LEHIYIVTQEQKAQQFHSFHHGSETLVLLNAWDAASARVFEDAGSRALGTTSAGIAAVLGYPDRQRVGRDEMLYMVRRIAGSVKCPVTADMESGYATTPEECAKTARLVWAAGAVGMNFEDRLEEKELFDTRQQVEKIRAIREAAPLLVLNARTDVFLAGIGEPASHIGHAVRRANAYREAGAHCLFVPGVRDAGTIDALVRGIQGPVNVLAVPGSPSIPKLKELGVARVSVGSGAMRATLKLAQRIAHELNGSGTYAAFSEQLSYDEVNSLFVSQGD